MLCAIGLVDCYIFHSHFWQDHATQAGWICGLVSFERIQQSNMHSLVHIMSHTIPLHRKIKLNHLSQEMKEMAAQYFYTPIYFSSICCWLLHVASFVFVLMSIDLIDCCLPHLLVVYCCMSDADYNGSRKDNIIVSGGRKRDRVNILSECQRSQFFRRMMIWMWGGREKSKRKMKVRRDEAGIVDRSLELGW